MSQKMIDETGNKYGLLTVIEKTKDKNGRAAWKCKCDCGNEKIVRGSDLRKGKITSCGYNCKLRYTRNGVAKDETGNKYGRLTVLGRAPYKKEDGKILWHCKCDCGNELDVRGTDLRNGHIKSCGCYSKDIASERQFKDETGNKYGLLTVISLIKKGPEAIWRCKCQCGNEKDVKGIYLRAGNVKSCGCLKSWYEEEIARILDKLNINYEREKTYPNLISDNKVKLRFDFAILNNNKVIGLVEYQGEQHFKPVSLYGGEQYLTTLQKYDKRKKDFCIKNNIPLLILDKNNNLIEDIIKFINTIWE